MMDASHIHIEAAGATSIPSPVSNQAVGPALNPRPAAAIPQEVGTSPTQVVTIYEGSLAVPGRQCNSSNNRHPTVLPQSDVLEGLRPPQLNDCSDVTGATTGRLRIKNKQRRVTRQATQGHQDGWTMHTASEADFPHIALPTTYLNSMYPQRMALHHLAAATLLEYATQGCPTRTGAPWSQTQLHAAIRQGPHASALVPAAMAQLDTEVAEKVQKGQVRLASWTSIKDNPPRELKISPIAMVLHLSFPVKLTPSVTTPSVNDTTTKLAPRGAIDQMGHSLSRIIHAMASADPNAKIFMAKFDIKDRFWRLDCKRGEEWNFAYVLPSSVDTNNIILVVPTSLQMGGIESPLFFCVASETARDVSQRYANFPLAARPPHKFLHATQGNRDYKLLPR